MGAQGTTMDAAVLHALGEPPRCEQFPDPVAGQNEVIVHVHAAALKPVDKQLASGSHYASPGAKPRLSVVPTELGISAMDNGCFWRMSPTLWRDGTTDGCAQSIHIPCTRWRE